MAIKFDKKALGQGPNRERELISPLAHSDHLRLAICGPDVSGLSHGRRAASPCAGARGKAERFSASLRSSDVGIESSCLL